MAPFETPVVPPVYWSTATSSRPGASSGGDGGFPEISSFRKWTPSSRGTRAHCPVRRSFSGASQFSGKGR